MLRFLLATAVLGARLISHGAYGLTASTPRPYHSIISSIATIDKRIGGDRRRSCQAPLRLAWVAGSAKSHTPLLSGARSAWARSARDVKQEDGENDKPNLPGSGLRGVDTGYLQGSEKANAEWFQRTAEREARGQLAWYEDPAVYIALVGLVPLVILVWGVLNCYIPGLVSCETSY